MFKTLGRLLLGSMFIFGGAKAFAEPGGRVTKVEDAGIPQARQATILNAAIMVVAGTALAAGLVPKFAATLLIGTLIPTTYVGHPYWKEENPGNRANQQTQFLKNTSMLGGLLLVLSD
ncbi:MAG: DoxX family protein [Ktedonobacteraceae bacterium]|nr:DoxX family protein [Ktedonobacteraceae bacterium]